MTLPHGPSISKSLNFGLFYKHFMFLSLASLMNSQVFLWFNYQLLKQFDEPLEQLK